MASYGMQMFASRHRDNVAFKIRRRWQNDSETSILHKWVMG